MYQCKYPHLFTPVRLGNTWFRNRLFAAPVGYEYFTEENYPTPEAVAFYERKAMGGAATVCIGSAAVDHRRGVVGKTDICLDDPNALPPVRRLATAMLTESTTKKSSSATTTTATAASSTRPAHPPHKRRIPADTNGNHIHTASPASPASMRARQPE